MASMPLVSEWSYVQPGDPLSADVDTVRFYLQDTDVDTRLMGDLELQYLVDTWMPRHDSLIYVASVAADIVAAKLAGVVNVTGDGVSVALSDLSDRYAALAATLRRLHNEGQVGAEIDIENLMWDAELSSGIKALTFGVGAMDNPWAGQQDYAGRSHADPYEQATRALGGY